MDFFETCAMLITLVLFGKYLEALVSRILFYYPLFTSLPCFFMVEREWRPW